MSENDCYLLRCAEDCTNRRLLLGGHLTIPTLQQELQISSFCSKTLTAPRVHHRGNLRPLFLFRVTLRRQGRSTLWSSNPKEMTDKAFWCKIKLQKRRQHSYLQAQHAGRCSLSKVDAQSFESWPTNRRRNGRPRMTSSWLQLAILSLRRESATSTGLGNEQINSTDESIGNNTDTHKNFVSLIHLRYKFNLYWTQILDGCNL